MPVIMGSADYPLDALDTLRSLRENVIVIDALKIALDAGNPKAVNVVLLGLLSRYLKIDKNIWIDVMKETVPAKFLETNLIAFEAGYKA